MTIPIKALIEEDFSNYIQPSMFIGFPNCSFKCEKDCGMQVCQNSKLATAPNIFVNLNLLIERYCNNPITKSIVIGGLEPFDNFNNLVYLVFILRNYYHCDDTVVVYTGYNKNEIKKEIDVLKQYKNIIIKFGRYIPNQKPHIDKILGVELASDNQYAEKIS